MFPSKFEDLPNEILFDLFENYMQGTDLVTAFYLQQNARIDGLIRQCQSIHLSFVDCRLDEFNYCLRHLKSFQNRIRSLIFNQQRIPEQLHTFLATYKFSFGFQQLRYLSLSIDLFTNDWPFIQAQFSPSTRINLEILKLRFINARNQRFSFSSVMKLFEIPTLKRLKLDIDTKVEVTSDILSIHSGIEYLTLTGFFVIQSTLIQMLMSFPQLRYLDIDIAHSHAVVLWSTFNMKSDDDGIDIAPYLRTLKICMCGTFVNFRGIFYDLRQLKGLRNLIIYGVDRILWIFRWKHLLQMFLPNLIQFHLRTIIFPPINFMRYFQRFTIFDSKFWKEKSQFSIMIGEYQSNESPSRYRNNRRVSLRSKFEKPLVRQWSLPRRPHSAQSPMLEHIRSLDLCLYKGRLYLNHHFNNVTDLVFNEFNTNVLQSLKIFLNLSKIHHVDLTNLLDPQSLMHSFLQKLGNLRSIRMPYALFHCYRSQSSVSFSNVKHLDIITCDSTPLNEANIIELTHIFPCVEHLAVNSTTLINIARLSYHWPSLNTFTHRICDDAFDTHRYRRSSSGSEYRSVARLPRCGHVNDSPNTHWIDRRAFLVDPLATTFPSGFSLFNSHLIDVQSG